MLRTRLCAKGNLQSFSFLLLQYTVFFKCKSIPDKNNDPLAPYYPLKKYVESESFFFSVCCPSVMSLSPCLNDYSYSWVVNLLQLVFNQAGSKQKCRK